MDLFKFLTNYISKDCYEDTKKTIDTIINNFNAHPINYKEICVIDNNQMDTLKQTINKNNCTEKDINITTKLEKHELLLWPELFEYFGSDGNLVNGQFEMEKNLYEYNKKPWYLTNIYVEINVNGKILKIKVNYYKNTP